MGAQPYRLMLLLAWAFVLVVTAYDIRWAFVNASNLNTWEANPFMRWLMEQFGIYAGGIARFSTVMFGASLMPLAPRRCQISATVAIVMVHTYLAAIYAMILFEPGVQC